MNFGPTSVFWVQLFGALALETSVIVLASVTVQRFATSTVWRRTLWQAALLGLGLIAVLELTGVSRAAVGWGADHLRLKRPAPLVVRIAPSNPVSPIKLTETPPTVTSAVPLPASVSAAEETSPFAWWPGIVWLAGLSFVLGRAALCHLLFLLFRRRRELAVEPGIREQVQSLAVLLRIRRKIRVTCTNRLTGPVAFGFFRPAISLPPNFSNQFAVEQREAMLIHELAHLAARDPWWYLLAEIVTACLWWQPLAWWARRQLQIASESAADEASVLVKNGPETLAGCLVELGRRLAGPKTWCGLGIEGGGFRSGLGRRVERLVKLNGHSWRPASRIGGGLARAAGPVLLALAALACVAGVLPHQDGRETKTFRQSWAGSVVGLALEGTPKAKEPLQVAADEALKPEEPPSPNQNPPVNPSPQKDQTSLAPEKPSSVNTNSARDPDGSGLHTRVFHLDPNTFVQGLQDTLISDAGGDHAVPLLGKTNDAAQVGASLRRFFEGAGVELSPPKAMFFNDRSGMLMVRATLLDLDTIEQAIQLLNMSPAQVVIEVKFCEIAEDNNRSLGFDGLLGSTIATNAHSSNSTSTAILTDPQFRTVLKALQTWPGVDLLTAPKVTTLSGRPAQIKIVDVRYIVTDLSITTNSGTNATREVASTVLQPITERMEFGPLIDVVPYVLADGHTIQMTVIASIKEFLGYEDAPGFMAVVRESQGTKGSATQKTSTTPLPKFRERQIVTTGSVSNGQTLVLAGGSFTETAKMKEKVPVLGDLPLVGTLFRKESSGVKRKRLLIFITPTLIDPAGNRIQSAAQMPFAK